ncbi:larval cuticle protein 65Ag1 [Drosophila grimshawi]|uniref:GH21941 n=1 Tax=Drosophila grimshawi TaxID=7222 RepID=B4J8I3_DROGR|nr:larval cuticle protein 65Ag1 [Drosophila grimshawi]EDW02342.1 GH21941 [Drosophila grimshawi]
MFRLRLFWVLCWCASWISNAAEGQEEVAIIKSLAEQKNDGSYFFAYEGADGSYREEVGIVKRRSNNHVHRHDRADDQDDDDDQVELEVSGVYRYIDDNGQHVEVSYVADKNGFVPMGTHITKEITETAHNAVQALKVQAGKQL